MKRIALAMALLLGAGLSAHADQPGAANGRFQSDVSLGELTPTPEMWFYQQELRRYHDPAEVVRRKAEFEAEQRRRRIATRRWFGYSNMRPTASTTPHMGTYSPTWGGNAYNPFLWRATGGTIQSSSRSFYGLW